jgi:hypothetical protein
MNRCLALSGSGFLLLFSFVQPASSQTQTSTQTLVRDPQALALLQGAATAMGSPQPTDSVASGSITTVAGSTTDSGTVRILTKGTSETAVEAQMASGSNWSIIYANGEANRVDSTGNVALPLEQVASSQSTYFLLPVISGVLANSDACYQYIGLETLNGASAQHIRVWNSFNSTASMQFLSSFTNLDLWVDPTSGLPTQVSFVSRSGGGSAPKIPITVSYSNYQSVNGVLYPHQIQQTVNGTLWATVTIQSVIFNSGLSDSNFPVTAEAN